MKMNIRLIPICAAGLLLLAFLGGTTHAAKRRPGTLDLKTPLDKIQARLISFIENFDLNGFLYTILQIAVDCLPANGGSGTGSSKTYVATLTELKEQLRQMNISSQEPKGITIPSLKDYCSRDGFKEIHDFVWVDDHENKQMEDLVNFFCAFGYPNAFENVKTFYEENECTPALIDTLPSGPCKPLVRNRVPKSSHNTNLREVLLTSQKSNPFANPLAECNLVRIIIDMIKVEGSIDLLNLLLTLLQEFETRAALQFMVGKIQEPIKGRTFRALRLKEPFRMLLNDINEAIISIPIVQMMIIPAVEQLLGLDLTNTSLVEVVVSLLELVLWRTTDAVPIFVPPAAPTTMEPF